MPYLKVYFPFLKCLSILSYFYKINHSLYVKNVLKCVCSCGITYLAIFSSQKKKFYLSLSGNSICLLNRKPFTLCHIPLYQQHIKDKILHTQQLGHAYDYSLHKTRT